MLLSKIVYVIKVHNNIIYKCYYQYSAYNKIVPINNKIYKK